MKVSYGFINWIWFMVILSHINGYGQAYFINEQWMNADDIFSSQMINLPDTKGADPLKWNVEIGAGFVTGPYVGQLKEVFKVANLQGCINTFFGQECYPKKNIDVAFMASISRDVSKNFAIGAAFKRSLIGGVEGTSGKEFSGDGFSVAPVVIVQIPKTWWFIGVGPAYHNFNLKFSDLGTLIETLNHKKYGFLVDAGMAVPTRGVVFGKLNLSYLYLGEIDTGNYEFTDFVTGVKTTMPSTGITFNQLIFSLGLGFRL